MTDPSHRKPPPARHPRGRPTPVRELNGETPSLPAESDVAEAYVEAEGFRWTVRVLGQSGRASAGSAPLLLLGFWEDAGSADSPSLEAMVVARGLAGLSPEALEAALRSAVKPPDPDRKSVFFRDVGHGRGG
mgnify:CR=1 FL=1